MGAVPPWSGRKRNDRFRAVGLLERTSEVLWTRRYVLAKLAWPRGASPMTIIDSQVHAYKANTAKRPWHSGAPARRLIAGPPGRPSKSTGLTTHHLLMSLKKKAPWIAS